ncbi:hypothetical protein GALMADRAFT_220179 [Galerina marginata CBS 339.88]|uniref:Uncharacterized protein n=1 Tax=Galerina marginata (strain CBS 339.88) TaxID=685588 RepID=A0A067TMI6_GALM3|nr:hypothetical protein GALMADRAFT_220179 [Galerina marginata CBS 339.88]
MSEALIRYKGIADIIVGLILALKPSIIYESFAAQTMHSLTGLHISDASIAPGFNQSIACMVAAVGVGHIVASRSGPAAHPTIFAMNLTWAILGFCTCATPKTWGLGSATLLMTSCSHTLFSLGLFWTDPGVWGGQKQGKKRR